MSVIRTTEILMSLILETINSDAEYTWKFWIKVLGATVVISQIVCISFVDQIQDYIETRFFGRPVRRDYEAIPDDKTQSPSTTEDNSTEGTLLLEAP